MYGVSLIDYVMDIRPSLSLKPKMIFAVTGTRKSSP